MDEILKTKAFTMKVKGKMVAVASEEVADRDGEILAIDGWDLRNFKSNPQLLWYHNIRERSLPIGRAENIRKAMVNGMKKLIFNPVFEEITEFGRTVKKFYEEGWLNSFSVGFQPKQKEDNRYTKQELLEISAVPVPALPSAQILSKAAKQGIDKTCVKAVLGDDEALEEIVEDGKEEIGEAEIKPETEKPVVETEQTETLTDSTDGGETITANTGDVVLPKNEDDEPCEDCGKTVIPYHAFEKAPDSRAWDAGSAVSRIKKWASNEKGDVNFNKYSKGFAWYSPEQKDTQGGYKLPHHDIQGDTMVTVWRGVAAAMAALMGARGGVDMPDNEKKGVYNHLKRHYEQYEKPAPEYRLVEDQVLKGLDAEMDAIVEDYNSRKINKELVKIKEKVVKVERKHDDSMKFIKALELLYKAIKNSKKKGGEK